MMKPNVLGMFDGLGALGPVGAGAGLPGSGSAKPGFQSAAPEPAPIAAPQNLGVEDQGARTYDVTNYGSATYKPPASTIDKKWAKMPELPGVEPPKPLFDPGTAQKWGTLNKVQEKKSGGFTFTVANQYADFQKVNNPKKAMWDAWLSKLKNAAEFVGITTTPTPVPPFTYLNWTIVFGKTYQDPTKFGEPLEYKTWKTKNDKAISDFVDWTTRAKYITQADLDKAAPGKITGGYTPLYVAKPNLSAAKDLGPVDDPAALALVDKANFYFAKIQSQIGVSPDSYQNLVAQCKAGSTVWKLKDAQVLLDYMVTATDVAPVLVQAYSVFKGTLPLAVDGNPYPMTQGQYDALAVDLRGGSQSQWWDWSVKNAQKLLEKVTDAYNKAKKWATDKTTAQDSAITSALADADASFAEMQKYLTPLNAGGQMEYNPNVLKPEQYAAAKTAAKGSAWSTTSAKTFRDKIIAQTAVAKNWYLTYQPVIQAAQPQQTTPATPATPATTTTTITPSTNSGGGGGGGGGSMFSFAPPEPTPVEPTVEAKLPAAVEQKSALPAFAAIGAIAYALLKK